MSLIKNKEIPIAADEIEIRFHVVNHTLLVFQALNKWLNKKGLAISICDIGEATNGTS